MLSFIFKILNVLRSNMKDQETCCGKSRNNHVKNIRIVNRII